MGCLCGNGLYEKCFEKRRKYPTNPEEIKKKNPVVILPPKEDNDKKTETYDEVGKRKTSKKPEYSNYP